MQAYLQPCSRSSNSAVIGLHRLRSSTNRCALLALTTPRTACLPTVEVVRVMGHVTLAMAAAVLSRAVCATGSIC